MKTETETVEALAARVKTATICGPTILLHSGSYFSYEHPGLSDFNIIDIARGLSHICRFGGQCQQFYSVAEHSIYVSRLVPEHLRWDALLHDAAEAFIGDMPKPLKEMLPDYKAVERRVEAAISKKFGLAQKISPEIKLADVTMLRTEQIQLMRNNDNWATTHGAPAANTILECLSPDEAMTAFLREATILRAQTDAVHEKGVGR